MPYIKSEDRQKYFPIIDNVLRSIPKTNPFEEAEYVGYFLYGVVRGFYAGGGYIADKSGEHVNIFSHQCKEHDIKKNLNKQVFLALESIADRTRELSDRGGEVNFLMSSVIWGYLGASGLFPSARYATRAYMRGILLRIKDLKDRTEEMRRYL